MTSKSVTKAAALFQIVAGPANESSFGRLSPLFFIFSRYKPIDIKRFWGSFSKSWKHEGVVERDKLWFLIESYINSFIILAFNEQEERRAGKTRADAAGDF